MLASRSNARVFGVESSLETRDELSHVLGGTEGVFARCFLTSTPARVTERVDIGRPEVQASVRAWRILLASGHMYEVRSHTIDSRVVVESSGLSRDDSGDITDQLVVERSAHENGLGE